MSLACKPVGPVPEETARVARAAFPRGNPYLRFRDEFGALYDDRDFADLFAWTGRPAEAPWRLALVLVWQSAEGLSDRQAADAMRGRLDWKYALGLELTDPGFDASVLCEFRQRLVASGKALHLLDAWIARCRASGLLRERGRQRTDATHVLAVCRTLERLELVGEALRQVLNRLAGVAPAWLGPRVDPAWHDRYGPRFESYRLPTGAAARQALAEQIGADGQQLLAAVAAPDTPAAVREHPAVQTLRTVWEQQYTPTSTGALQWRAEADLPPAGERIHSPYEPEARFSTKRTTQWVGYKVHLTETCDPDQPHLITHVETSPATEVDSQRLATIQAALGRKGVPPRAHLVDGGYVTGQLLVESATTQQIQLVGPAPLDRSPQARAGQGYDQAAFIVDWERETVRCPQGAASQHWRATTDRHGHAAIAVEFAAGTCAACPARAYCTPQGAGPRRLHLRPAAERQALQHARLVQQTAAFTAEYAARAGVEGTLSQGVRVAGLRQARYVGEAKTRLQHILSAAALNFHRLSAWWVGRPLAPTRHARFLSLRPTSP